MGRHYEHGVVLFGMGRYRDAIDAFTSELSDNPDCALSYAMRAASWLNNQRIRFAQRDIVNALRLAPDLAYAHYILSCIHSGQGRVKAAEAAVREALRLDPRPEFFCRLGEIEFGRNRMEQCRRALEEGLALDPCHAPSLMLQAKALAAIGRHADACECLHVLLSQNPESPEAHHALGSVTLQSGNTGEALNALREARRLNPIKHHDRDALGAAYGRLLWPLRILDRYLLRYESWSPARRWCLLALAATMLIVFAYLLAPYRAVNLPLFLVAYNFFVAPMTIDLFAIPVGKVVFRKDLDLAWYRLLPESIRIVAAILFQSIATALAIVSAFEPKLAIAMLCFVPHFEFLLVLIRRPRLVDSLGMWALAFFGVFVPTALAITNLLSKSPILFPALICWMISLVFSYLLTVRWR
jgi:tetratricopeptide (TPR) repeat protein